MIKLNKTKWGFAALIATMLLAPMSAARAADTWPTRPVRFIVTLGAGSGVDITARLFADKLSARWGQPVVVENRPGGDGMVAITSVLGAHDDHVLLVTPVGSFTAHPYFHDPLPYDPREMVPVARITKTVIVISVPASLNINSLNEHTLGLNMAKVPYKNPVSAVSDLAEGRIQVYMPAYAIVRPQVQAGNVKLLAVTNHERAPALPDVPTAAEAGYPSLEFDGLVGLFGTRELAHDAQTRIAADIRTFESDPAIVEKLTATGQIVSPGNGAEFAASIEQQKAQVAAIEKLFGNKPVQ